MAEVFKLDDVSGLAGVDFLGGTLQIDSQSLNSRTAPLVGEYRHTPYGAQPVFKHFGLVVEQFKLVGEDTVANLIAAADDVDTLLEAARLYHASDLRASSTWLYRNADGEGNKRSLVMEGSIQYPASIAVTPLLRHGAMVADVAITRHPLWENTSYTQVQNAGMSCLGGKWAWSGIPGTAPARLYYTTFAGASGGGGPIYRVWAGIREAYSGTSGFQALWELEDGTNYTDASDVADGTASNGNKVQVSFATTATPAKRVAIRLENVVGSNYHHFVGRYLVLLRCKVGSGTTCGVQLKSGYWGTSNPSPGELVYVDNSLWRLVELGEVQLPPMGLWSGASVPDLSRFQLQVWAERVGGSGSLDLDALCLIPSARKIYVSGAAVQYVSGDTRPARVVTRENDLQLALAYSGGVPEYNVVFEPRDWYLPVGDGMLVLAGERETQHVLYDTLDLTLYYFPRWQSFRGT